MWDAHDGMGWWMFFGWIWFIFFVGVIVYLASRASDRFGGGRPSDDTSPQEILKRRYARGELSKEQYDQMRRDLS